MRSIKIRVTPKAEVTVEGVGFTGKACEKFTEALEQALGSVKNKEKKPEYDQVEGINA